MTAEQPVLIDDLMNEIDSCYCIYGARIAQARQWKATLSHIRVRQRNEIEAKQLYEEILKDERFDRASFSEFKGANILWAHLTKPMRHYDHHVWGDLAWIEFTAPNPEHRFGVDALVYKVPGLAKGYSHGVDLKLRLVDAEEGGFLIRLQPLSAEDILGISKTAA
jgi:hypothetical protein